MAATVVCSQPAFLLSASQQRSKNNQCSPCTAQLKCSKGVALSTRAPKAVQLSSSNSHPNALRNAVSMASRSATPLKTASTRSGMSNAEDLVKARKIRPINFEDLPKALRAEGEGNAYTLLDVRPEWEYARSHSASALHVPLFIEHDGKDIGTLLAKWFALGYGGLWMGLRHTKVNEQFLNQVKQKAPKEQRLVVACGDGLRSLLAAEVLYNAGYKNVAWLENGFRFVEQKDLPDLVGDTKLKYASAGGFAGVLLNTVDKFQSQGGAS